MMYNIISTGSKGNAVVINDRIMIHCGVPYKLLEPYTKRLKLVLLTHEHGDHFVPSSVRRLHHERPTLRFGCCEWMIPHLLAAGVDKRVIDVYDPTIKAFLMYGGELSIRPELLTHNVPNCGYHIRTNGKRLFYATDTGTMDGIEAKEYDLYMIEANHTKADIAARAAEKQARGEYAYEFRAAENHLSQEQAEDWLYQNMGPRSMYVFLHGHEEESTDAE
jgi:L-ascorbate metabolism protein UlaG (beta-lactamase superfamily)